jgi:hypothetical protein
MDVFAKLKAAIAAIKDPSVGLVEKFLAILAFMNAVAAIVADKPVYGAAADEPDAEPEPTSLEEVEAYADAQTAEPGTFGALPINVGKLIKIGIFLFKLIVL